MKILFIGLIFGCISYIGVKIGDSYSKKERFYNQFVNFIIYIKNQITFLKTNILEILESYSTNNKDLLMLIKNYKIYLETDIFQSLDILSETENTDIINFLKGVGKNDCFIEKEFLDKNIEFFNQKYKEARNLNLKYGTMYKKLGVLFAIFVCILLI